jgi:hypothetical protein
LISTEGFSWGAFLDTFQCEDIAHPFMGLHMLAIKRIIDLPQTGPLSAQLTILALLASPQYS